MVWTKDVSVTADNNELRISFWKDPEGIKFQGTIEQSDTKEHETSMPKLVADALGIGVNDPLPAGTSVQDVLVALRDDVLTELGYRES